MRMTRSGAGKGYIFKGVLEYSTVLAGYFVVERTVQGQRVECKFGRIGKGKRKVRQLVVLHLLIHIYTFPLCFLWY